MTVLIVIFVLMMQFLWVYIDDLVGKGLSVRIIAEFLGWGSATLLPMALPLATLLASIMTLGNLGENNELLAMKAAGISLPRILTPLTLLSLIIATGAFFASNNLVPVAYNNIYTLRDDIGRTKEEIKIPVGIFYNGIDGYTLRVDSRDKAGVMHEVMVYDHSGNKGNTGLTVADSGLVRLSPDKTSIVFTLFDGTSYEEDIQRGKQDTVYSLQRIDFDRQEVIIPLENYAFQKSDDSRYGNAIMAKNLSRLREDRDSLSDAYTNALEAQKRRTLFTANLNHTSRLDTAGRQPAPLFQADSLFRWKSLDQEDRAYAAALTRLDNQISSMDFYERELYQSAHPLRRTIIETYRKFTLSLACLIFFFIGAPLGAIIRKGGLGTPVIVSIAFFIIYWVIDISGKKLANNGTVSPFFGAFVSTFVLLPLGAFLTWKSTRDSALFNADAYLNFFKQLFRKRKKPHAAPYSGQTV